MSFSTSISRRKFIGDTSKTAAAATLASGIAPSVLRGSEPAPEANPVKVAQIGIGTRGMRLVRAAGSKKSCKVVAVCDVYKPHTDRGLELCNNPDAKAYTDYKEMLNDPAIEAVIIATPDHWHEKMLIDCIAAGKDVYCEKGWTTSMEAAKRMRKAVKDAKAVMQLGHQGRQLAAADVAHDLIASGEIGKVTLVNCGRFFNGLKEAPPWRWYGQYSVKQPTLPPSEVLKLLDWEKWLGDAPSIDFNDRHFWHWRCYWPYGTGQCGDLLSHEMDHVQTVLRYGIPDSCTTNAHNCYWKDDREVPDTWTSSYVFEKKDCVVTFEGNMNSRRQQTPEYIGRDGRVIFNEIGQNANLFEVFGDEKAYNISRRPQAKPKQLFVPGKEHRRADHMENFLNCVRTREKPTCNEDEAFIETAVLMMSMESYRQKRQVRWDAVKEEII
ncbi:MAG: Gfo/Idh/MocA family protein [Opitutales bacterium]